MDFQLPVPPFVITSQIYWLLYDFFNDNKDLSYLILIYKSLKKFVLLFLWCGFVDRTTTHILSHLTENVCACFRSACNTRVVDQVKQEGDYDENFNFPASFSTISSCARPNNVLFWSADFCFAATQICDGLSPVVLWIRSTFNSRFGIISWTTLIDNKVAQCLKF